MKIAITGKGGVGKTTIAASLSRYFAENGFNVLTVDADPDANLGLALGMNEDMIASIVPISEMKEMVEERTAADQGSFGKMFRMNPEVADIPERYAKEFNGVKLLTMGTVDTGGSGCVCPEHVLLKMLMSHLVLYQKDVVVMDMEAGIEHLGRGTAGAVDAFIVVVEPGVRSIQTYKKIKSMAMDIGVKQVYVIGNKIRNDGDIAFLTEKIGTENIIGFLKYRDEISESDRNNQSPYDDPKMRADIATLGKKIQEIVQAKSK